MFDDLHVLESVLAPPIANPFSERPVSRRSGDVRLGGEKGVRIASAIGRGQGEEATLDGTFGFRGRPRETKDLRERYRSRKISTTENTEDTEEQTFL
jgi:hypothetical protein